LRYLALLLMAATDIQDDFDSKFMQKFIQCPFQKKKIKIFAILKLGTFRNRKLGT